MDRKLYKPVHFENPKQIKFLDLGDTGSDEPVWIGGIVVDDYIICGCCGLWIPLEEYFSDWNDYGHKEFPDIDAPIEVYNYWVDISEAIRGDN